jgi:hypothetical protein
LIRLQSFESEFATDHCAPPRPYPNNPNDKAFSIWQRYPSAWRPEIHTV